MMRRCAPLLLLLIGSPVFAAPSVSWQHDGGADRFRVYCEPTPIADAPLSGDTADGTARSFDLQDIDGCIVVGREVEIWATAVYSQAGESAHSNHIQLTPTAIPQTIKVPAPPQSITITW